MHDQSSLPDHFFEWQDLEKHEAVTCLPGHLYPPE